MRGARRKSDEAGGASEGKGILFANDISSSRAKALLKNLELFGIPNICVTSENPQKLLDFYPEYFDKILIDAPCSGKACFGKSRVWLHAGNRVDRANMPQYRKELLCQAYEMLKPGGMMLYSTCTFSKEENENNIAWLLQEFPDLELAQIAPYEDFRKAVTVSCSASASSLTTCAERAFSGTVKKQGELSANRAGKAGKA